MNKGIDPEIVEAYKLEVAEAIEPLNHSWNKLKNSNLSGLQGKTLDELEAWEALSARFARLTDIFLSKYLRILVLIKDPGFRGEMQDYLDKAEKIGIISEADKWMKIRQLRNKIAHEYTKEDLIKSLNDIILFTPFVLKELAGIGF